MTRTSDRTRARSRLHAVDLAAVPPGTAVSYETRSHRGRCRGRLASVVAGEVTFLAFGEEHTLPLAHVRNPRVVRGLYEPGDPVVRVGVPEADWRGGVVRCVGRRVQVETLAGFGWLDETDIEPAERRHRLAPLPPGPVRPLVVEQARSLDPA